MKKFGFSSQNYKLKMFSVSKINKTLNVSQIILNQITDARIISPKIILIYIFKMQEIISMFILARIPLLYLK